MTLPGSERIVEVLAQHIGCEVVAAAPVEPAEIVVATDQVLREELGEKFYYATKRAVSERVRANRRARNAGGDE